MEKPVEQNDDAVIEAFEHQDFGPLNKHERLLTMARTELLDHYAEITQGRGGDTAQEAMNTLVEKMDSLAIEFRELTDFAYEELSYDEFISYWSNIFLEDEKIRCEWALEHKSDRIGEIEFETFDESETRALARAYANTILHANENSDDEDEYDIDTPAYIILANLEEGETDSIDIVMRSYRGSVYNSIYVPATVSPPNENEARQQLEADQKAILEDDAFADVLQHEKRTQEIKSFLTHSAASALGAAAVLAMNHLFKHRG